MKRHKTLKPATAETVNGLRQIEQLGGGLRYLLTNFYRHLQYQLLLRRFAMPRAEIIARLAFGVAR